VAETRAQKARAAAMTPAQKAEAAIKKGECDNGLDLVLNACLARVTAGAVGMTWRLSLDDLEVAEDDLTLGEADMLERLLDTSWGNVNPLKSAEHAAALIRVTLHTRLGLSSEEAAERTAGYKVKTVVDSISQHSEVDPPKA
jgi:hypothetical protein